MRKILKKFSTTKPTMGFLGIGKMGSGMIKCLRNGGFTVNGFDVNYHSKQELIDIGVNLKDNVKEVAINSDLIITMLPNHNIVRDICHNDGIFKHANKGTIVIDSSTISPANAIKLNEEAKDYGIHYVDAPVSGGVGSALVIIIKNLIAKIFNYFFMFYYIYFF